MYNKNTLQLQYKYNNIIIHYDKIKFLKFQISYETGQLWVFFGIYMSNIQQILFFIIQNMSQLITILSFQRKFKYVQKYPNKVVPNNQETTEKIFSSVMLNKSQQQN